MANECLEIRLLGAVESDLLPKVNESRFKLTKVGDGSGMSKIQITTTAIGVVVKLLNRNGYFASNNTASSGSQSVVLAVGDNVLYVKLTADDIFCIENSNYINRLGASDNSAFFISYANSPTISGDMDEFGDFTALRTLFMQNTSIGGNIGIFKESNISLTFVDFSGTETTGNIGSLSHCIDMRIFRTANSKLYGDIDVVRKWVILSSISVASTDVHGDLSSFANNPATSLMIGAKGIQGDINVLPNTVRGIMLDNQTEGITFSGNGDTKFPTLETIRINNCTMVTSQIDNLLIMTSKATVWQGIKTIVLKGSRSVASDSAVSTLQNFGVTITINPA